MTPDHIARYGEIYAAAFSGPPWNDPWDPEWGWRYNHLIIVHRNMSFLFIVCSQELALLP